MNKLAQIGLILLGQAMATPGVAMPPVCFGNVSTNPWTLQMGSRTRKALVTTVQPYTKFIQEVPVLFETGTCLMVLPGTTLTLSFQEEPGQPEDISFNILDCHGENPFQETIRFMTEGHQGQLRTWRTGPYAAANVSQATQARLDKLGNWQVGAYVFTAASYWQLMAAPPMAPMVSHGYPVPSASVAAASGYPLPPPGGVGLTFSGIPVSPYGSPLSYPPPAAAYPSSAHGSSPTTAPTWSLATPSASLSPYPTASAPGSFPSAGFSSISSLATAPSPLPCPACASALNLELGSVPAAAPRSASTASTPRSASMASAPWATSAGGAPWPTSAASAPRATSAASAPSAAVRTAEVPVHRPLPAQNKRARASSDGGRTGAAKAPKHVKTSHGAAAAPHSLAAPRPQAVPRLQAAPPPQAVPPAAASSSAPPPPVSAPVPAAASASAPAPAPMPTPAPQPSPAPSHPPALQPLPWARPAQPARALTIENASDLSYEVTFLDLDQELSLRLTPKWNLEPATQSVLAPEPGARVSLAPGMTLKAVPVDARRACETSFTLSAFSYFNEPSPAAYHWSYVGAPAGAAAPATSKVTAQGSGGAGPSFLDLNLIALDPTGGLSILPELWRPPSEGLFEPS